MVALDTGEERRKTVCYMLGSVLLLSSVYWLIFTPVLYKGPGFSFEHNRWATVAREAIDGTPIDTAGTVLCRDRGHVFKVTYVYGVKAAEPRRYLDEFLALLSMQGKVLDRGVVEELVFGGRVFTVLNFEYDVEGETLSVCTAVMYEPRVEGLYYFVCSSQDSSAWAITQQYLASFRVL